MKTLLTEVKAYAIENYNTGWDVIVEAYEDDELLEAINNVGQYVEAYTEKKEQIEAEIF